MTKFILSFILVVILFLFLLPTYKNPVVIRNFINKEECDEIIILPTHGVKNSLNVSNCCSIVIWEALRQLEEKKRDP